MVLEPSAEQVGATDEIVGIAGFPVAAALLKGPIVSELHPLTVAKTV
jgi:hypothetical protein